MIGCQLQGLLGRAATGSSGLIPSPYQLSTELRCLSEPWLSSVMGYVECPPVSLTSVHFGKPAVSTSSPYEWAWYVCMRRTPEKQS